MTLPRSLRLLATTLLALVVTAGPAAAHTTATPGDVSSSQQDVTLTFQAPGERVNGDGEVIFNERLRILVPSQFAVSSCTGPQAGITGWTCTIDADTHAPHTLVTYEVGPLATAGDVRFEMVVDTPLATEAGTYLFKAMQTYADGFTAPWNYEEEPYPAPRVSVDGDETVVNPEGAEGNACFGPPQPASSAEHDGSDGSDVAPCPQTQPTAEETMGTEEPSTTGTADEPAPSTDDDTTAPAPTTAAAAATDGRRLADTGGGAVLLGLGLLGMASSLRRREVTA